MADKFGDVVDFPEIPDQYDPGNPETPYHRVYGKSDGYLYGRNSAGEEIRLSSLPEFFIGTPAELPVYPALIFEPVIIEGETVYKMVVNAP